MQIVVSHTLSMLPSEAWKILDKLLNQGILGFTPFFPHDDFAILQMRNEEKHLMRNELPKCSLIPYQSKLIDDNHISIQFRDTGFLSLLYIKNLDAPLEDTIKIHETIKYMKHNLIGYLGKICSELRERSGIGRELTFGSDVTVIIDMEKPWGMDHIERIGARTGNYNLQFHNNLENIIAVGRSFNYFGTTHPPRHRRGRRQLRSGIIHGILISHGIFHQLRLLSDLGLEILSQNELATIMLFSNPFVLRINYHNGGIFGSGLHLIVFRKTASCLDIFMLMRNLLLKSLQQVLLSSHKLILINYLLQALPYNKLKPRILKLHSVDQSHLTNQQDEIFRVIESHTYEIQRNEKTYAQMLNDGLTRNQIIKKLNQQASGRKYISLDADLGTLISLGLIVEKPFKGKGRGINKKQYTLNYNYDDLRQELIELVDEKLSVDFDYG